MKMHLVRPQTQRWCPLEPQQATTAQDKYIDSKIPSRAETSRGSRAARVPKLAGRDTGTRESKAAFFQHLQDCWAMTVRETCPPTAVNPCMDTMPALHTVYGAAIDTTW